MKKLVLAITMLTSPAFATTGIECKSIDGTLEIYTEEAIAEGDNVITLGVIAPWIQKDAIVFSKINGEVNLNNEEGSPIYMASNTTGQNVTLLLNSGTREGVEVSTALLRVNGKIYSETVRCVNADLE